MGLLGLFHFVNLGDIAFPTPVIISTLPKKSKLNWTQIILDNERIKKYFVVRFLPVSKFKNNISSLSCALAYIS